MVMLRGGQGACCNAALKLERAEALVAMQSVDLRVCFRVHEQYAQLRPV